MPKKSITDQAFDGMKELQRLADPRLLIPEPPQYQMPSLPDISASIEQNKRYTFGYAEVIHSRLKAQIEEFERGLKADEEVGGYLASFGPDMLIHVRTVTYRNPYLIVFQGILEKTGARVELVQHTTQLNVLFRAVPKIEKEAKRIGFGTSEK